MIASDYKTAREYPPQVLRASWRARAKAKAASAPSIEIERYGRRNFAVKIDGELLAVTAYKRGAFAVKTLLETLRAHFGYLPKLEVGR